MRKYDCEKGIQSEKRSNLDSWIYLCVAPKEKNLFVKSFYACDILYVNDTWVLTIARDVYICAYALFVDACFKYDSQGTRSPEPGNTNRIWIGEYWHEMNSQLKQPTQVG